MQKLKKIHGRFEGYNIIKISVGYSDYMIWL